MKNRDLYQTSFVLFSILLVIFFSRSLLFHYSDFISSAGTFSHDNKASSDGMNDTQDDGEASSDQDDENPRAQENYNSPRILIDPGHQKIGDYSREPLSPVTNATTYRMSTGTLGVSSGKYESALVLEIALQLEEELSQRGYDVILTRYEQDVNISNKERALMATEHDADLLLSIHGDGYQDFRIHGASVLAPRLMNDAREKQSGVLGTHLISEYSKSTSARNRGVHYRSHLAVLNWSNVPSVLIELGFMTNPEEDEKMQDPDYQVKMVQGLANGIDSYFSSLDDD